MNQVSGQVVVVVVIFAFWIILLFSFVFILRKGRISNLKHLAEKLGLKFDPGVYFFSSPRITGVYRGHPLQLEYARRGIRSSAIYTEVTLKVNNERGAYLKLSRSWLNNNRLFPEFDTGDASFDREVAVIDRPAGFARAVLASKSLRRQLLGFETFWIMLDKQNLSFRHFGYITNEKLLQQTIDLMCLLADSVNAIDKRELSRDLAVV
jgi:hypothetical protein